MAKQGIIGKAGTIAKSFLTPLPVGEEWYEKRLEICGSCEYNSKNIDQDKMKLKDKIQKSLSVCDSGDHCTACGCCIERKCATKTEDCGLIKLKKELKWQALVVDLETDGNISVENLSEEQGQIISEKGRFVFDFKSRKEETLKASIVVRRKGGLKLKDFSVGCSCTVANHKQLDTDSVQFDINISTKKFSSGVVNNKTFTVNYYDKANSFKSVVVNFKVHKI